MSNFLRKSHMFNRVFLLVCLMGPILSVNAMDETGKNSCDKKDKKKLNIKEINVLDRSLLNKLEKEGKISNELQKKILKAQLEQLKGLRMAAEHLVEIGDLSPSALENYKNFPNIRGFNS